ncbi:CoA-transferase, partial [Deinococcus sonorensis]
VLMEHAAKDGSPKLLRACTLPLTGAGVVHRVITELGVLDVTPHGFQLVELAPHVAFDHLQDHTGAPVQTAG